MFGEQIKGIDYDNGFRLTYVSRPSGLISSRLIVRSGGLNEVRGEEGLSHFLEHILANSGSERISPEYIRNFKTSLGMANASTGRDFTTYVADFLEDDLGQYLDMLSECVFNPRYDHGVFEAERNRIFSEISNKRISETTDLLDFYKLLFRSEMHTYDNIGKTEVVGSATFDDLMKLYARGYSVSNAELILVGNLPVNVADVVEEHFGRFSSGVVPEKNHYPRVDHLHGQERLFRIAPEQLNSSDPKNSKVDIVLGFLVPYDNPEEQSSAEIVSELLDSYLFNKISRQEGLVYSIYTDLDSRRNALAINVFAGAITSKYERTVDSIFREVGRFRSGGFSDAEFENMRRNMKYLLLKSLSLDSTYANLLMKDKKGEYSLEHVVAKLDTMTPDMLRDAAGRYLPADRDSARYAMLVRSPYDL